jgi:hypothetical protein
MVASPPGAAAPPPVSAASKTVFDDDQDDGVALVPEAKAAAVVGPKRPSTLCDEFDVAVNLFRMLCVWLAHYVCQERYFHTLFFCTQIDVPQWRDILVVLFSALPRHFKKRE